MPDTLNIHEYPKIDETVMLIGWRQWADAGSTSSALPRYLIQQNKARHIGSISPDGFYLFQVPGTHDLVRPVIKFAEGYPESLDAPSNDLYYAEVDGRGVVIFTGEEPHMDIERYSTTLLEAARQLKVKKLVCFGGVYAELPYDRERPVSGSYSLPHLKEIMDQLAVNLSNYQGGASIGSYICRRAGDQQMECYGLYAFVPTYDFSGLTQIGNTLRIEQDHMAWYGVMRRLNYLLKINFDLTDLEEKSKRLIDLLNDRVDQLDKLSPQASIHEYFDRLSDSFTEVTFNPLADVWETELRRLLKDDEEGS